MDDSAPPASDSEELPACPYCSQTHPADRLKCPETDMPLPLRGRELSGKFRFVRKLGKGGMASVWLAVNMAVDREVAIKVIRPEVLKNEDLVARFRSEAKAAGRIGHPNVCEILDFGVGPIGPYIVMESLRGINLAQLIRDRGKLPAEEAVGIVLEALEGLEAAHDRGIIHRDLKPENVFLHEPLGAAPGAKPVVKLMDFGVAKFTDGSAEVTTEHGALLGTPEYMAPEQFKGANLAEARTDIWAVGAILYRALTGKHPFKGPTVAATLLMVSHEEPTPIHEYAPDVPPTLVEVIARCMSKEIEDRYADVAELRTALKAAMVFEASEDAVALPPLEGSGAEALDTPVPPLGEDAAPAPEDSMMSRRPTEAFRVQPPASRRVWWVVGAFALVGVAAVALWPDSEPKPPPTEVAQAKTPPPEPEPEPDPAPVPPLEPDLGTPAEPEPEEILEVAPEPDVGSATPRSQDVPPPPGPDAFEDMDDPDVTPAVTPSNDAPGELPAGVVDLGGGYVLAKQRGKRSDHNDARKYCEALAVTAHMGFTGWKLPFPGLVKRIKDAGSIPRGTYWTSARWRGNVTTFALPGGDMRKGVNAERRSARTLCVAEAQSRQGGA